MAKPSRVEPSTPKLLLLLLLLTSLHFYLSRFRYRFAISSINECGTRRSLAFPTAADGPDR